MPGDPSRKLAAAAAAAAAAALALALALAPASAAAEPPARERAIRVAVITGMMGLYVVSETAAKDALSPDACRWCNPGGLDDGVREAVVWSDTPSARRLSDVFGYGVSPVAASALLLVAATADAGEGWGVTYADDIIAMFEVVWGTQLVTQLVKITVGRQRPYAHYGPPAPLTQEDNLSFFSGHSSLTFSLAVGAGVIAQRRGYRLAPVIWATGLTLGATTAYLRMAADRHYFTDVLVGAAAGALGGALIPRLTGSLPLPLSGRVAVIPQPGGLALAGSF